MQNARLRLQIEQNRGFGQNYTILVQALLQPDSPTLRIGEGSSFLKRPMTVSKTNWTLGGWFTGDFIQSPDLSPLIAEVTSGRDQTRKGTLPHLCKSTMMIILSVNVNKIIKKKMKM